jgi:TetR/AcrR family tetracycline transcriptional repressor
MPLVAHRAPAARRRRTLSREQVIETALSLLDQVGLEKLTMRRLAARLGVRAASLYRHVRNKEELMVLLADAISADIPLAGGAGTWREQLTFLAWNVRRGLAARRDAAIVLANTPPAGPHRLKHIDAALRVIRSSGLSERDAVWAAYHLNNFVTEFAADEARFATFAAGKSRRQQFAWARRYFASLPPEEYPNVVALAGPLTDDAPDELFQFGIDCWLDGLEKRVNSE